MEQQWKDIKNAYLHILKNSFPSSEEQDRVNIVFLKLFATIIDLTLSGDIIVKNAINIFLGDGVVNTRPDTSNIPVTNHPNISSMYNPIPSNTPNTPNLSNPTNNENNNTSTDANVPNMNNMFQFVDRLMNRNVLPTEFISNEELRNLFPLWNMFERPDDENVSNNDATESNNNNSTST